VKSLNPFDVPGSPQAEQRRNRRERFRFVVWTIVVANVLLLMGMLIQGCQREPAGNETSGGSGSGAASSDTNGTGMAQQTPDTNGPIAPTFEPPVTNKMAEAPVTNALPNPIQGGTKPYVVVKGDTFHKIAKRNGISLKALADANPGVSNTKLKVGQMLQLPAGAKSATKSVVSAPTHASPKVSTTSGRYVVKPGDTLNRIARAHGTTVQAIKTANGLTSDRIAVGRALKMPEPKAARGGGVQV
jgi:LysM repeat protein